MRVGASHFYASETVGIVALRQRNAAATLGNHRNRNDTGFLLAEVMVSLLLLSIAVMALVPLAMFANRQNAVAGELTAAGTAAQDKAEYLKSLSGVALAAGQDVIKLGARSFNRTWTVQTDKPLAGFKTVTVTVTLNQKTMLGRSRATVVEFYRRY